MAMNEPQLETLYRGDSRRITVTIKNKNGVPISLTDKTIVLTIAKYRQGTPVVEIENTGIDDDDSANGITVFDITPDDSIAMEIGLHHIDIVLYSDPTVSTAFLGTIRIENRVSIPT